jgi:hypothetical protein
MMNWFGKDYGAPYQELRTRIKVPVGATCVYCDETIAETDDGIVDAGASVHHRECFLRSIFGSINHQIGMCSCKHPGMIEEPEVGTKRQAAGAAVRFYEARSGREDYQRATFKPLP